MRRALGALLHTPTVRMKQLAADPDGDRYAATLHRLFDLDPESVAAFTQADADGVGSDVVADHVSLASLTLPPEATP